MKAFGVKGLHLFQHILLIQNLNTDRGALLYDRGIDAARLQDVLEAFESLYRGSTFEVKCLVKVPVVKEQFVLVLSHVER